MKQQSKQILYYCPIYSQNWADWTEIGYLNQPKEIREQNTPQVHAHILLRYATSTALQRARLAQFEAQENINMKSGRKSILFLHETYTLIPYKTREKQFANDTILGYFVYEQIEKITAAPNGYGTIIFKDGQQYTTHQNYRSVRELYQLVKRYKNIFWEEI